MAKRLEKQIRLPKEPKEPQASTSTSPPPSYGRPLLDSDIPMLRDDWTNHIKDLTCPIPEELPPFREINHEINLIDESKQYNYHNPRCPDHFVKDLNDKIERYTRAGWWVPKRVEQALPMLCVAKKDGRLRTVFDCRKRNANTVKDATPFPDQDRIRNDVARAKYRTKIDMSEAYEQIRVLEKDVHKTGFATIQGTFESNVIQQGDCNAPSTFQRLMTLLFRSYIGRFVHCYLDDIFIYSDTIEDHQHHLSIVFNILQRSHLFLSSKPDKLDLYSVDMDCLGYRIDTHGIHCDTTKVEKIINWPVPRNYHEVQKFNGLVNYIGTFLPEIALWTGPLSSCCANKREFNWTPHLDECFRRIKEIVAKAPVLKPIDPQNPDQIYLICDASASGVGAMLGQGSDWRSCRPAAFMSRKFSSAQFAYFTLEQETLAILEALKTWEDKLIGRHFTICTDHEALKYLLTQKHLSRRQTRWIDYLSRFDFAIQHIPGSENRVADCLSRYYELLPSDVKLSPMEFVSVDRRLDPEGDDLPLDRRIELRRLRVHAVRRRERLNEERSERHSQAEEMEEAENLEEPQGDPEALGSVANGIDLKEYMERYEDFASLLREHYSKNTYFSKVSQNPERFESFSIIDGLIYHSDRFENSLLCIPREAFLRGRRLTELIIDHAHNLLGHLGALRTLGYIRRYYWWPTMAKDTSEFCRSCTKCQMTKASNQHPQGLLQPLPVPSKPWESVGMDFLGPFPPSEGFNYLFVVICRLTSMIHLIPTRTTVRASEVAELYHRHVWRLHGLPTSIVSDRDSKFTSAFWKELNAAVGTTLLMSSAYHPQTDGSTERANRTVAQILRSLIKPDQTDWVAKLPSVEFAINSSVSATTGYSPFEVNYGYVPDSSGLLKSVSAAPGVKDFADKARWNLLEAHDHIISSRIQQTHYANQRRRPEESLQPGDLVFLSTENLRLPKSRARKLIPKFIGPYRVTEFNDRSHTARLALSEDLRSRKIFDTFHVSKLRKAFSNDLTLFPLRDMPEFYDLGKAIHGESPVQDIIAHRWEGRKGDRLKFYLRFQDGDWEWQDWAFCEDLKALDAYLELRGVKNPLELPKENSHQ
jgi:transposase InsO family protein